MEVVTDALPSPPRSRSSDETDERQGQPVINIPVSSPNESITREHVLTNAACSTGNPILVPRHKSTQREAQIKAKAQQEPEEPPEGIPASSSKASSETHPSAGSTSPKNQHSKRRGPAFSPHGTKCSQDRKSSKSSHGPTLNICNSKNVVVGSVSNFTINQNKINQNNRISFENLPVEKREQLERLFNSTRTVDKYDIIIVSENLDKEGLKVLCKDLGLTESVRRLKKQQYKYKGPNEISYQTLEYWRLSCCGGENQAAMLSRLCDKLAGTLVWEHGGKEALDGLYSKHFGDA